MPGSVQVVARQEELGLAKEVAAAAELSGAERFSPKLQAGNVQIWLF
jgi:hypothetical protein